MEPKLSPFSSSSWQAFRLMLFVVLPILQIGQAAQAQQFPQPSSAAHTHSSTNHSSVNHSSVNRGSGNQANPNQMMNMLDEVASGKSPTLPPGNANSHSFLPKTQQHVQMHGNQYSPYARTSLLNARGANHIALPPLNHAAGLGGIIRPGGANMGHGHAMGMALGAGAMAHGMHTMGGGSHMTGANAAQFLQQLKQKMGAMQPQGGGEEAQGNPMAGMGQAGGAGNPFAGMGQAGGGGSPFAGMGQAAGGGNPFAGMGQAGGGGNPFAGMGRTGGGGNLGMRQAGIQRPTQPVTPPAASGGGFNFGSIFGQQAAAPGQQAASSPRPGSMIKRPPGVTGITSGAMPVSSGAGHGNSASDLERQMEQQYGR